MIWLKNIWIFLYSVTHLIAMALIMAVPAIIVVCIMFPLVPLAVYTYWVVTGFIVP